MTYVVGIKVNATSYTVCFFNAMDGGFDGDFPAGLKVLVVDDNRTCLLVLETMLRKLSYEVTTCQLARHALALLREDKNRFDIVLCDLHMPEMDGLKLLEIIGLEMDLPVVMMSSDDGKGVIMKGIIHGACDYLVKPVQMEAVRLIWQHVVRKRQRALGDFQQLRGNIHATGRTLLLKQAKNAVDQMPARERRILKRARENDDEDEDEDDEGELSEEVTTAKKPRVIWTQELHDIFVIAVNQLRQRMNNSLLPYLYHSLMEINMLITCLPEAVPKKILERMQAMNVTGLSRANIASHLQKYRLHLRKGGGQPLADNRDVNLSPSIGQASSFNQFNLQFQQPTATGSSCNQLPMQNLMITPQPCTINDSVVPDSTQCFPTELSTNDLSQPNLLFQNDVPTSNVEHLYRNVGVNVSELSNPISSVDDSSVDQLIYEPSFLVRQYDQEDFFHGGFPRSDSYVSVRDIEYLISEEARRKGFRSSYDKCWSFMISAVLSCFRQTD
ncbi:hypothetical protein CXB51_016770 [Gossypium anomalum]|uniref:Response regulatory domain-containing protein n=1 Tax=Gossypium anomalum TaxID=47600 RepID=A0A8J6CYZ7_9ROSI|nr:hypothetical protein CXB51_016770 [Gossypium anomalum]